MDCVIVVARWIFAHPYLCSIVVLSAWVYFCRILGQPWITEPIYQYVIREWIRLCKEKETRRENGLPVTQMWELECAWVMWMLTIYGRIRLAQQELKSKRAAQ